MRLLAMASRLLCLTRGLGGGSKSPPELGTVSLTSSPSSVSSAPPHLVPSIVERSPALGVAPASPPIDRPRLPVLASVESVPVTTVAAKYSSPGVRQMVLEMALLNS